MNNETTTIDPQQLYTPGQVAEIVGVSRQYIHTILGSKLDCVTIQRKGGPGYLVSGSTILAYLANRQQATQPVAAKV